MKYYNYQFIYNMKTKSCVSANPDIILGIGKIESFFSCLWEFQTVKIQTYWRILGNTEPNWNAYRLGNYSDFIRVLFLTYFLYS